MKKVIYLLGMMMLFSGNISSVKALQDSVMPGGEDLKAEMIVPVSAEETQQLRSPSATLESSTEQVNALEAQVAELLEQMAQMRSAIEANWKQINEQRKEIDRLNALFKRVQERVQDFLR